MSTVIEKIKEAEQEAEEIRSKALEKSRENIRNSQETILRLQKEKVSKAKHDARNMLEKVEMQITKEADAHNIEEKKTHGEYKKKIAVNVDKAVETIVTRILEV